MAGQVPDTTEKSLRFGCGFVVAFILAGAAVLKFVYDPQQWLLYAVTGFAALVGLLAIRFWDPFWDVVSKVFEALR